MRLHLLQHASHEGPGLIARWAASRGVRLEIRQLYRGDGVPEPSEVEGLIVMGGPMGAGDDAHYPFLAAEAALIRALVAAQRPVLGICLGAQLLARALGAHVMPNPEREIGWFSVRRATEAPLPQMLPTKILPTMLSKLPPITYAFHWHGDTFALPEGATNWLSSEACLHQLFTYGDRALGIQFHPEVDAEALAGFARAGADELARPGRYVQSATGVVAYQTEDKMNDWAEHALDVLFGVAAK